MKQKILSETEFDQSDDATPIGDKALESHLTYRQNKKSKSESTGSESTGSPKSQEVDGSPLSDGMAGGNGTPVGDVGGMGVAGVAGEIEQKDKINNLTQKETAMARAGVSRDKVYGVIARLLDAKVWKEVFDKEGNGKWEQIDDLEKQKLGADMALKAFGDMVERKEIEYDLGDKTLDVYRRMSVGELKAKAAELLLGKRVGVVVDAEIERR